MQYSQRILAGSVSLLMLTTAFAGLFSVTVQPLQAVHSECSDGLDNDENGEYDYPQDEGCSSVEDDYEGVSPSGNFVTITDGREQVAPGDAVVYIITLKQQRDTTRNVNVDLHLPSQATIASASDGGSISNGHIRWTNVSVYNSATRTLQVHVNIRPDAKEEQYMVARVVVEGGADATDTTFVKANEQRAQDRLRVSITDGLEYAVPGQDMLYRVNVKNIGTHAVTTDVRATVSTDVLIGGISNGGEKDGTYTIVWKDVPMEPGQERVLTFDARLYERTADRITITSRASAGIISASDTTTVRIGLPYEALSISITDDRNEAEIGQILTYTVRVRNAAKYIGSDIAVDASLPLYSEFVSATEGGYFDGSNVRWLIIGIAPGSERILQFSVRVRSDAPLGAVLTAGAVTDGQSGRAVAQDRTTVVRESYEIGRVNPTMLFRKTADRAEAMPGGQIRYTITVQNTLNHVVSDAVIVDKFDSRYLTLGQYDRGSLIAVSDDRMEWKVPVLKQGEVWQTSYVLSVSPNAPHGLPLENVATIRGADVASASLTERVWTGKAGVITQFPTTGGSWDLYLLQLLALVALGTTGAQYGLGRKVLG
jgi:uncharacterized repeat protein (TIGR01451 family)